MLINSNIQEQASKSDYVAQQHPTPNLLKKFDLNFTGNATFKVDQNQFQSIFVLTSSQSNEYYFKEKSIWFEFLQNRFNSFYAVTNHKNENCVLKVKKYSTRDEISRIQNEAEIQLILAEKANSDFILAAFDYVGINKFFFFCMPLGIADLFQLLPAIAKLGNNDNLHQTTIYQIIGMMIEALKACHALEIFHNDLRLKNFILFPDGVVKLTDWDCACFTGRKSAIPIILYKANMHHASEFYTEKEIERKKAEQPIPEYKWIEFYKIYLEDLWRLARVFAELINGKEVESKPGPLTLKQLTNFITPIDSKVYDSEKKIINRLVDFVAPFDKTKEQCFAELNDISKSYFSKTQLKVSQNVMSFFQYTLENEKNNSSNSYSPLLINNL